MRRLLKEQKDDCGGGGGQNSPLVELEMVFDEKYLGYLCIFLFPPPGTQSLCSKKSLTEFNFGKKGFLSKMNLFGESSFTNDRLTSVIALKPKGLITGIHRRRLM